MFQLVESPSLKHRSSERYHSNDGGSDAKGDDQEESRAFWTSVSMRLSLLIARAAWLRTDR